jgi:hypothetical protein
LQQCANNLQSRCFQSMPGSPSRQTTRTGVMRRQLGPLTRASQGHMQLQEIDERLFSSHKTMLDMHIHVHYSSRSLCCACPLFTGVGQGLCPPSVVHARCSQVLAKGCAPPPTKTEPSLDSMARCAALPTHFLHLHHTRVCCPWFVAACILAVNHATAFIPRARASPPKHSLVRWPRCMDFVNVGVLLVQQRVCNRMRQVRWYLPRACQVSCSHMQ